MLDSVDTSSLHMPLPASIMACMQIEDNEESIFAIMSSKKDQSLIIFGRVYPRNFTFVDSKEDLKPPQFFHYARLVHHVMKMGYDLCRGESLNFGKGRRISLQPFIPKEKPPNYYNQTRRGL